MRGILSFMGLVLIGLSASTAQAETFSGRITAISDDGQSITVASSVQDSEETFSLANSRLRIKINRKPGKASDLRVGDRLTVFTSSSGAPLEMYVTPAKGENDQPESSSRMTSKKRDGNSSPSTPAAEELAKFDTQAPWPQFLGPNRSNRSLETGLLTEWPESGPKLLWTARNLGEGYSAVSVAEGKVFTLGTRDGAEIATAINLQTGRELWSARNGTIFQDNMGNGPRSTPTYEAGKIYCLGASGDLSCFNTEDGQVVWQQNILSQYSANNIVWGISESPLLDGELLICTPGGPEATMVALKKETGEAAWKTAIPGNPQAGYASAVIAELNGVKQYVNFCHGGLFGVDAQSGQPLWGDNNAANSTANCSSAIPLRNAVFYASGYGTGGALLRFESRGSRPNLAYKTEKMKNHHGGMVELNGYIYGANENILTCLAANSGKLAWQDRLSGQGKGAITFADGHLYFRSEQGPMFLLEANPEKMVQKGRFEQPERSSKNAWARPVIADGKLFLRDQDVLLCYDLKK